MKLYKMTSKLPKSLTPEEFVLLLKNTKENNKQARVAFLLAYGAGLRISEVCALKKENIKEKHIEVIGGKGDKDRMVPIPKGWKQWMTDSLPIKKHKRNLERDFCIARDKAKLNKEYHFHCLRHSFATRCVEQGMPITHVQSLMGHSNLATTSIYTQARPVDALKSYEELF